MILDVSPVTSTLLYSSIPLYIKSFFLIKHPYNLPETLEKESPSVLLYPTETRLSALD